MANNMTFEDISTVLNSIMSQATGKTDIVATNTQQFVAQADITLKTGYDRVLGAISQVIDKTVYSQRPYRRKFASLYKNSQEWGNHVRKLQMVDSDFESDDRTPLTDGQAVDMYKINKGKVRQTNFYGGQTYQFSRTYFKDQLDQAFRSPDELARFISMYTQNMSDVIEQAHENLARMCVANYIGAKCVWQERCDTPTTDPWVEDKVGGIHRIKLLNMYNTETGLSLSATDLKKPVNYAPFYRWAIAKILTYSDMMTERSTMFNIRINKEGYPRHSEKNRQKLFLYSPEMRQVETQVLSTTFHNELLKLGTFERVNFWQSIKTGNNINCNCGYTAPNGLIQTWGSGGYKVNNIFAVLLDTESLGYTMINEWSSTTPFNSRGGYTNVFYHFTDRYWNDLTEFGLVFTLN